MLSLSCSYRVSYRISDRVSYRVYYRVSDLVSYRVFYRISDRVSYRVSSYLVIQSIMRPRLVLFGSCRSSVSASALIGFS